MGWADIHIPPEPDSAIINELYPRRFRIRAESSPPSGQRSIEAREHFMKIVGGPDESPDDGRASYHAASEQDATNVLSDTVDTAHSAPESVDKRTTDRRRGARARSSALLLRDTIPRLRDALSQVFGRKITNRDLSAILTDGSLVDPVLDRKKTNRGRSASRAGRGSVDAAYHMPAIRRAELGRPIRLPLIQAITEQFGLPLNDFVAQAIYLAPFARRDVRTSALPDEKELMSSVAKFGVNSLAQFEEKAATDTFEQLLTWPIELRNLDKEMTRRKFRGKAGVNILAQLEKKAATDFSEQLRTVRIEMSNPDTEKKRQELFADLRKASTRIDFLTPDLISQTGDIAKEIALHKLVARLRSTNKPLRLPSEYVETLQKATAACGRRLLVGRCIRVEAPPDGIPDAPAYHYRQIRLWLGREDELVPTTVDLTGDWRAGRSWRELCLWEWGNSAGREGQNIIALISNSVGMVPNPQPP